MTGLRVYNNIAPSNKAVHSDSCYTQIFEKHCQIKLDLLWLLTIEFTGHHVRTQCADQTSVRQSSIPTMTPETGRNKPRRG
eukprot:3390353-Amphidinium_carterae.2